MANRYFIEPPIRGKKVRLTGAEAHHLIHVMRAGLGSTVRLFDGTGAEFAAQVERIGRSEVELAVLSREEVDRELPIDLTLGVALPKGDRQKWLIEKLVELGLGRTIPLITSRSVARPGDKALDRLRRTVIEASKHCGRNRLMEIATPQAWPDFLAATASIPCRFLAHPASSPSKGAQANPASVLPKLAKTETAIMAVGPEGGFTSDELSLATAGGWQPIDLGPRILRIETAALLLTAVVVQSARQA